MFKLTKKTPVHHDCSDDEADMERAKEAVKIWRESVRGDVHFEALVSAIEEIVVSRGLIKNHTGCISLVLTILTGLVGGNLISLKEK